MVEQDIFVGIVAMVTGLFVFSSAAFKSEWVGRFWIARHIESASNESVARYVVMAIGALCMILGALLILGFFPSEKAKATARAKATAFTASSTAEFLPAHE